MKGSKGEPPERTRLVGRADVMARFALKPSTLSSWIAQGAPVEPRRGRKQWFCLKRFRAWMEANGKTGKHGNLSTTERITALVKQAEAAGSGSDTGSELEPLGPIDAATIPIGRIPEAEARAKLRKEIMAGLLKEAELLKRRGELLDRAEVERSVASAGAVLRQGLLALPGKMGARLAHREAAEIQTELDRECRSLLSQLSRQIEEASDGE